MSDCYYTMGGVALIAIHEQRNLGKIPDSDARGAVFGFAASALLKRLDGGWGSKQRDRGNTILP